MKTEKVSFILTVYNKASSLPFTIQSLLSQHTELEIEYIFVDDNSTDFSVAVIRDLMLNVNNVTIIENSENRGPAVRLNQGAKAATGEYLFLIDADDILLPGAIRSMYKILRAEGADFIYGNSKGQETDQTAQALLNWHMPGLYGYSVSNTPLKTRLFGMGASMGVMVRKTLYDKAKGADETLFIQDESVPLRLGYHANRSISLDTPVYVMPKKNENNLSTNKDQQHHDKFYAYYHALQQFKDLAPNVKRKLYRRMISPAWESKKQHGHGTRLEKITFFFQYALTRYLYMKLSKASFKDLLIYMDNLENVRRL